MNFIEHHYEVLYDIQYDPHETINLVNDPRYKETLNVLRKRFAALKRTIAYPGTAAR